MAFIRPKTEEHTGYQSGSPLIPEVDNDCDFIMVYRLDGTTESRIREAKDAGYVVHFMTGISWGHYQPYLYGEYDGLDHWDEAQTDRFGNRIMHSPDVPYMVPTVSFTRYLTEKLKRVVDAGVEAIHVEEPEFWDRAGYSPAFKREYELYYRAPWSPPHESVDAAYKCAKLKQYLFARTIDRVSTDLKDYSLRKYGKTLRFYVPTHSLLNYTQWKIVSPEGKLADIPGVDGCIAQVWTGTSREKNWYEGRYAERTFETAYLEYGVMQELVNKTGRRMWFLHDPIEDNSGFDWEDYRRNYLSTVTASLLHPRVNDFEICPWPTRVFTEKYPKNTENAEPIPGAYASILNNMFQTLGTLEATEGETGQIGIVMADSQLFQRQYPDGCFSARQQEEVGTVLVEKREQIEDFRARLFTAGDAELGLKFMQSATFPGFYGLAMPLLKHGYPVRPVLLDNVRRYPGYLNDYKVLILSYEFLKPESPDMNTALAEWVKSGGTLIYVGDGSDPFHAVDAWWTGRYPTPAGHLFRMLGVDPGDAPSGVSACGDGIAAFWRFSPAGICYSKENADRYRGFIREVLKQAGLDRAPKNTLTLRRGRYLIAAVMDESCSDAPLVLTGNFVDMYAPDFKTKQTVTVTPGDSVLLCDLDRVKQTAAVVGTSVRIRSMREEADRLTLTVRGAGGFTAYIRIKTDRYTHAAQIDGVPCVLQKDALSGTVLVRFESVPGERTLTLK